MRMKIFAIYDQKANAFINPFYMPEIAQGKRAFEDAINDRQSTLSKHPEDYTLFELGAFDNLNADFILHDTPKSLGLGIEYVKQLDLNFETEQIIKEGLETISERVQGVSQMQMKLQDEINTAKQQAKKKIPWFLKFQAS